MKQPVAEIDCDRVVRASRRSCWSPCLPVILIAAAILGVTAPREAAAQATWSGTAANTNWSTAANWLGTAPTNNSARTYVFTGVNGLSNTNDLTSGTATSITFTSSGFALSGSALTLGGTITNNITSGTNTIGLNMAIGSSDRTITGSGGSTLVLSGNISGAAGLTTNRLGASGTSNFVLSGINTTSGTITLSGNTMLVLGGTAALGTGTLRARGTATLDVSGGPYQFANTLLIDNSGNALTFLGSQSLSFTGTTLLGTGNLQVSVSANTLTLRSLDNQPGIASAGFLAKSGNGTLVITDAAAGGFSRSSITLNGGVLEVGNGSALGSGTLTLTSGTFQTSSNLTIANPIVGGDGVLGGVNNFTLPGSVVSGKLNKAGNNTVTLSGSNSYTGITAVSAGVLLLNSANALPGGIGSSGGASNLALGIVGGQNDGVVGLTTGTFARNYGTGTNQVNMQYGGGFAAYAAGQAVNLGGVSGTQQWGQSSFLNAAGAILVLGASDATHAIDFQNPLNLFSASGARTIKVNNGQSDIDAIMSGVINNSGGSGGLTKTGSGVLAITAANTYTGTTTISAGALRAGNASALGTTAAGTVVSSGAALELADGIAIGAEALTIAGSGVSGGGALRSLSGANSYGGAITATDAFSILADAGTLTLGGVISSTFDRTFGGAGNVVVAGGLSGVGNVFKTGTGALTLSVGNSQANTTVSAGQLNVNHLAALGTPAGTLSMAAGTRLDNTSGAAVAVTNPKSILFGSSLTFLGSDDLDLGTGNVSLASDTTIDIVAKELTLSGDVLGAGYGITKTGTGTLRLDGLSGSNSFNGNSFVNAGTLLIEGSAILGGGTSTVVTVADGAFLQIGASAGLGDVTVVSRPGGVITASVVNANQTFDQSGTLTTSNANFNGIQTIESGVTITTSHNYLGTVPVTTTPGRIVFQNNATLRATAGFEISATQGISLESGTAILESDANQALLIPASVAGAGGIRKVGAGNIRLTGSNTYSGGTVIEQGIVGISFGESLGDVSGRLKLDGGTIVAAQTISGGTISQVTIDSARQFVLANGKTSGIDAQTNLSLRYDGVITEENGGGAAAGVRIGSGVQRQGTVIFGGANTYRGDTTIDYGTLKLASGGSFANSPRIIVGGFGSSGVALDLTDKASFSIGSNQTLQGIGTAVLGPTTAMTVSGLFSPGNSPGLFTYSGGSTTLSGTTLLEIWGTTRSTGYDAVNVIDSGLLSLGGALVLDFNQNFADTDSFLLFDTLTGGSLASGFSGITITGANNDYTGLTFVQSGSVWTTGFNGNNQGLRVTQTASSVTLDIIVVPEPGTLGVAGIGIAMASWSAWKRRRTARPAAGRTT
jgi:fibronectin-binding autotransporter adhesin